MYGKLTGSELGLQKSPEQNKSRQMYIVLGGISSHVGLGTSSLASLDSDPAFIGKIGDTYYSSDCVRFRPVPASAGFRYASGD